MGYFLFWVNYPFKASMDPLAQFPNLLQTMWCDELKPVAALQKLPAHLPSSQAGRQWPHAACVSLWSVIRQDREACQLCCSQIVKIIKTNDPLQAAHWIKRSDSDWESV